MAIVLGSGMGEVARRITSPVWIPFHNVPGLTAPSVGGHNGRITFGHWTNHPVLAFEGRLHLYEGHTDRAVTQCVHVAFALGARTILFTNAAGGIHDSLSPGSLMAIRDHIEWNRPYCWRYPVPGGTGPERTAPYSAEILAQLHASAKRMGMELYEGVYASVLGPTYETPAEIRALRACGADAVGMSTTREVSAAAALGMRCAAISCITNRAAGLSEQLIKHEDVLATTQLQSDRLGALLQDLLRAGERGSPSSPNSARSVQIRALHRGADRA
jgi:purine-nucleoside phosphorylase